jgi:hypothetical protein
MRNNERDLKFIVLQGFEAPEAKDVPRLTRALLFQPRVVGVIAAAGAILERPAAFAVLAALLWCAALLPRSNPFDLAYRHTLGRRPGSIALPPAPMPRRFAAGEAALFATAIAGALAAGFWATAWLLQAILALAVVAVPFGRFCLGAFTYHLLRGRRTFALRALPWRHDAEGGWASHPS